MGTTIPSPTSKVVRKAWKTTGLSTICATLAVAVTDSVDDKPMISYVTEIVVPGRAGAGVGGSGGKELCQVLLLSWLHVWWSEKGTHRKSKQSV
jgi:hypothetical protein